MGAVRSLNPRSPVAPPRIEHAPFVTHSAPTNKIFSEDNSLLEKGGRIFRNEVNSFFLLCAPESSISLALGATPNSSLISGPLVDDL